MYDVSEKRVAKVFKICKKYLERYQLSVFRGSITPSKIIKLRRELKEVINPEEDIVSIIKFPAKYSFEEEQIGKNQLIKRNLFF